MRVRMLTDRNGGRYDGQDWPPAGSVFDVPDGEAAFLIAEGHAEAAGEKKPAPKAKTPKPASWG